MSSNLTTPSKDIPEQAPLVGSNNNANDDDDDLLSEVKREMQMEEAAWAGGGGKTTSASASGHTPMISHDDEIDAIFDNAGGTPLPTDTTSANHDSDTHEHIPLHDDAKPVESVATSTETTTEPSSNVFVSASAPSPTTSSVPANVAPPTTSDIPTAPATQAASGDNVISALTSAWTSWLGFDSVIKDDVPAAESIVPGVNERGMPAAPTNNDAVTTASQVPAPWLHFQEQLESVRDNLKSWDTKTLEESTELIRKQSEALFSQATKVVEGFDTAAIQEQTRSMLRDANVVLTSKGSSQEGFLSEIMNKEPDPSEMKAPWDELSEQDKRFAEKMREALVKMVVDCVYSKQWREKLFLHNVDHVTPLEMTPENTKRIKGAMFHDKNLSRLYGGVVPKYIRDERVFWGRYFYHCDRILKALIVGGGELHKTEAEKKEEEEIRTGISEQKRRDWDTEIDEIFGED